VLEADLLEFLVSSRFVLVPIEPQQIELKPQANELSNSNTLAFILKCAQHFYVVVALEWAVLRQVARVEHRASTPMEVRLGLALNTERPHVKLGEVEHSYTYVDGLTEREVLARSFSNNEPVSDVF
jgi:hypothetical protein